MVTAAGAMDVFAMFDSPDSGLTQLVRGTRRNDTSIGPCVIRRPQRYFSWRGHTRRSSLVQAEPRACALPRLAA